jgi:hypothetical protein
VVRFSVEGEAIMAARLNEVEVRVGEVVDYLRMTGQFQPALSQVINRKITAMAAEEMGIKVSPEELQRAADTFRATHDLGKASDTENWLATSGITLEAFEEYLETNILISKFKDELEAQVDKKKYSSLPEIQESIRELIYSEWLKNELK